MIAVCATTSAPRRRRARGVAVARRGSSAAPCERCSIAVAAGHTPAANARVAATARANACTRQSMAIGPTARAVDGSSASIIGSPARARNNPASVPVPNTINDSNSTSRRRSAGDAPRLARSANSARRVSMSASVTFAMFVQATASSSSDIAKRTSSTERRSPNCASRSDTTSAVHPCSEAASAALAAISDAISPRASPSVRP